MLVAVVDIINGNTENCAVCGDQRKINTERLVHRRHRLLHEHLYELNQRRDDHDEHDGSQIIQTQRIEHKFVDTSAATSEDSVRTKITAPLIPLAVSSLLETPRKEQIPRN
jgi:hypothetical protein